MNRHESLRLDALSTDPAAPITACIESMFSTTPAPIPPNKSWPDATQRARTGIRGAGTTDMNAPSQRSASLVIEKIGGYTVTQINAEYGSTLSQTDIRMLQDFVKAQELLQKVVTLEQLIAALKRL
jgi:hypothetical protein